MVAQGFIDLPKAHHLHPQERERAPFVLRGCECLGEQVAQTQPVRQTGDRVEIGHALDGRLRCRGGGARAQGGQAEAQVIRRGQQKIQFLVVEAIEMGLALGD